MPRSVVRRPCPRCPGCRLPPRWCVCGALRTVECPLAVDILMARAEAGKPSSTGLLIQRVLPATRIHVFDPGDMPGPDAIRLPGRELWVLHPQGGPVPPGSDPARVQALLLDGNWPQAAGMLRQARDWGRLVALPMAGRSRYWLRAQQEAGRFSTAEALIALLDALGLATADGLRRQFELLVHAGLRARCRKDLAEAYLAGSPVREDLLAWMQAACLAVP